MIRALVAMLAFLPAVQAGSVEVPLKYERHPDKPGRFVPRGTGMVSVGPKIPEGQWKLPRLKGKVPLFGLAALGDRRHLLVLDRPEGGAYSLLYFDAEGGGDLSKVAPIQGVEPRKTPALRMIDFPGVDMEVRLGDKRVPYSFKTRFYHPEKLTLGEGARELHLYLDANCSWWGEFRLEGLGQFLVALGDGRPNGRFDDVLGTGPRGSGTPDYLYLTDAKEITPYDMIHLGRVLVVRGRTYRVGVDLPGRKLRLEPVREELATLRLAMPVERMSLTGPQGGAALFRCEGEVGLPAGRYTLLGYMAARADEAGGVWRLMARTGPGAPEVAAGEGAVLGFGEPFTARVGYTPAVAREGAPTIKPRLALVLAGAGGEQVSGLDLLTPGKTSLLLSAKRPTRPREAAYTVTMPDGKVLGQGTFEYG